MAKNMILQEAPAMLHAYPPFYKPFRCTASACPDNCCVGWEVVVDDDTAKLYSSIPGSLGDALRGAMTVDADGDRIIAMTDGHCPFWTQDHLCRVELELGHDAPCATCRKFPRLTQDYGVFTEYGLTLACPEAARLVLTQSGPWTFETEGEAGDPAEAEFDWDALADLIPLRQALMDILWRGDLTGRDALLQVLQQGQRCQDLFDGEENISLTDRPIHPLPTGDFKALLRFYLGLELLTEDWKALLEDALDWAPTDKDWTRLTVVENDLLPRNLGAYYLSHYWFQAVADYDCLLKIQLLAAAWALTRCLCCHHLAKYGELPLDAQLRVQQLYAKEVEHDDVNRAALEDALVNNPAFSLENLILLG